jgi:hypothetical protein
MASAPAGTEMFIEQAVGYCGGSTVLTDMFKISHKDKNGRIVQTKTYQLYAKTNGSVDRRRVHRCKPHK